LLDAARALLAERSVDMLTVDKITERADVAKGTFYNYFGDKDALTRELQNEMRARVEDEIARNNAGVTDPLVRIARALCCVMRLGLRQPSLMIATGRLFPLATDPSAPQNKGVREDVIAALATNCVTAASPDAPVAVIIGVAMAGVNRVIDLAEERREVFVRDLGTILLHGLGLSRVAAARVMQKAIESVFNNTVRDGA
jgi:AcrR family transcriptional regulator